MHAVTDPYTHHPELRGKIVDPLTSFFRTFSLDSMLARYPELAAARSWAHSDSHREGTRARTLAEHGAGDLWIFAYGSLMWDPAFQFAEVRRASVPGYARRFVLKDIYGARGTREAPGLMAALDRGDGCEGLAFRIAAQEIEAETEILWRREMIGPGYIPTFVPAVIDGQPGNALTFVADHSADQICPELTRREQVQFIAQGKGFLGTSKDYLCNIVSQFAALGIVDDDCTSLLQEVEACLAAQKSRRPIEPRDGAGNDGPDPSL
ncbi:gamma-glutamylcyclotransferase [Tropicimonas sp. IMCC34043]|uniref:gamma-glutamylcyclotransferase n=1 Tax=Tropicimonas sp. IMCC34043 TaxID=2248760 RepID=UPI000E235496|nr:gamma-glutamylcyclotransferase [Tropicimonas sp. IMCC34043]